MGITGWDWRHHGITSSEARARIELVLALARVFPLPVLLATLSSDPALPMANRGLAGNLVAVYAILCAAVLIVALFASDWLLRVRRSVHVADTALSSALLYLMAPSAAPLVLVVFLLIAAAARWGSRATLATGGAGLAAFIAAATVDNGTGLGVWRAVSYAGSMLALTLMVTALAGQAGAYFAQREVLARALANIGAASSFAEALRLCLSECLEYFGSPRAILAAEDLTTRRGYLWKLNRNEGARPTVEEIGGSEKPEYFADWSAGMRVWYARQRANGILTGNGLSSSGRQCALSSAEGAAARAVLTRHGMSSLLAAETVLTEWRVRLLVFDPVDPLPSDSLQFLKLFIDRAGPVLQRDYDVRSLRSRVGAMERARIARELHDGPIQSLVGLDLEIEALRRHAERAPIQTKHLARLREGLRHSIADTRDLMLRLQPTPMSGDDVLRVIAELAVRLRRESGLDVWLVSSVAHLDCSSRTCRHLTRIVQEALTNVRKHSGARSVTITLSQGQDSGRLSIEDDGRGFGFVGRLTLDELEKTDLGPKLIKERVKAMHGRLTIESQPGAGANIEVDWPRGAYV